jgi:hypothetical protein
VQGKLFDVFVWWDEIAGCVVLSVSRWKTHFLLPKKEEIEGERKAAERQVTETK